MTRLLALTATAFLATPLCAADPKPTPILGIGVVSADQKFVFLPAKEGGIEAVDLATGKAVWTNKDANKLAGTYDGGVLAWVADSKKSNTFRIVAVSTPIGKTAGTSDPIVLPDWATTAKTHGRTFRTAAKADAGTAVVAWQAGAFYAGGARPTPEIEAAARKNESGTVTVDLRTGKVVPTKDKPKDDDFKVGPAGGFGNKVGAYEFQMTEELPGFKPGTAMVTKVTFTVTRDKKELWKRELAGNPWMPPPP